MAKRLKVYGWQGWRGDAPPPHRQTREVVAAESKAAAARAAGVDRPSQLFNLSETGNEDEIACALSAPGVVLWHGLDDRSTWHRADGGVVDFTSYAPKELVERAVRNAHLGRHHNGRPRWSYVADAFAVGSTSGKMLCRRYGIDPDEVV